VFYGCIAYRDKEKVVNYLCVFVHHFVGVPRLPSLKAGSTEVIEDIDELEKEWLWREANKK
jgi:hypothetical protein